MHFVLSFHKCGGNVGDSCNIPLPSFVLDSGKSSDIWYEDQHHNRDDEYISLFADDAAVIGSLKRTPMTAYSVSTYSLPPLCSDVTCSLIE